MPGISRGDSLCLDSGLTTATRCRESFDIDAADDLPPNWSNFPRLKSFKRSIRRQTEQLGRSLKNFHYFSRFQRIFSALPIVGAIVLASLNVWAATIQTFKDVLRPRFLVLCPVSLLFCAAAVASVGCRANVTNLEVGQTRRFDEDEEATDADTTLGQNWLARQVWFQTYLRPILAISQSTQEDFSPGGVRFRQKVHILGVVKMVNMIALLLKALETGQLKRYITFQAFIIMLNGLFFPYWMSKHDPKYSVIGLIFWDLFVDAMIGAFLPIAMITELTIFTLAHWESFHGGKVGAMVQQIRFLIIANRFVPQTWNDLLQLLIPYFTLVLRLRDVKRARKMKKIGLLQGSEPHPMRMLVIKVVYRLVGGAVFLLCLVRLFFVPRCDGRRDGPKWGPACLQQTYISDEDCECIYFYYDENTPHKVSNGTEYYGVEDKYEYHSGHKLDYDDVAEMLQKAKKSLVILSIDGYRHSTFPNMTGNVGLRWLFLKDGKLKEMKPFNQQENMAMERVVVRNQSLRNLPSIAMFTGLRWLDVATNELTSIPSLDKNKKLERVIVSHNHLQELPCMSALTKLKKLRAIGNELSRIDASCFKNVDALNVLELGDNRLANLNEDFFDHMKDLQLLSLENNRLTRFPRLENNRRLWFVDASGNYLTEFAPFGKEKYDNMTEVNLCFNNLTADGRQHEVSVKMGNRRRSKSCHCCRFSQ